jgi:predicted GNAT family acetyltransferase
LRSRLNSWLPDVAYRQPFMAMIEGDDVVSLCASVRISTAVHCAGVETHPEFSRRGYASSVVAAWARQVHALGATPFYSTSWDNIASQRVAGRVGLELCAVDFGIN